MWLYIFICRIFQRKGKVCPVTCQQARREVIEGGEWSALRPGRFAPRKILGDHCVGPGWGLEPVWISPEYLTSFGVGTSDRPAPTLLLYRLHCSGFHFRSIGYFVRTWLSCRCCWEISCLVCRFKGMRKLILQICFIKPTYWITYFVLNMRKLLYMSYCSSTTNPLKINIKDNTSIHALTHNAVKYGTDSRVA